MYLILLGGYVVITVLAMWILAVLKGKGTNETNKGKTKQNKK